MRNLDISGFFREVVSASSDWLLDLARRTADNESSGLDADCGSLSFTLFPGLELEVVASFRDVAPLEPDLPEGDFLENALFWLDIYLYADGDEIAGGVYFPGGQLEGSGHMVDVLAYSLSSLEEDEDFLEAVRFKVAEAEASELADACEKAPSTSRRRL